MIRIMLILLAGILGVRGFTSQASSIRQVAIDGRIYLDDVNQFNFERLSIFIQHSNQKNGPWTPIAPVVPNEKGEFIISVPAGSWVSITVNTSDPTIRFLRDPADEFDFYSLGQNEKITVFYQRLYVPSNSVSEIEWKAELKRGAAFSICTLDKMKGGAIYFRKLDNKEDKVHMVSFTDLIALRGYVVGGLIPGDYEITYVDDNDVKWMVQQVRLNRSEVLYVKCNL